jgi:hypothetical protein
MPEWNCCDTPVPRYSGEESTKDGGKRKFYLCLTCTRRHIVTFSKEAEEIDHVVVEIR